MQKNHRKTKSEEYRKEILMLLWEHGRLSRRQFIGLTSFDFETNTGRITELEDRNHIVAVGREDHCSIYQLTDQGKTYVSFFMGAKNVG